MHELVLSTPETALLEDPTLGQFDINVITLGGKLWLIGVVDEQAQIATSSGLP